MPGALGNIVGAALATYDLPGMLVVRYRLCDSGGLAVIENCELDLDTAADALVLDLAGGGEPHRLGRGATTARSCATWAATAG